MVIPVAEPGAPMKSAARAVIAPMHTPTKFSSRDISVQFHGVREKENQFSSMVGCNNLLQSAHDGLHRVQDPVIVVEEGRLLALQAITVESIAPSKIVAGAAPNH